ncbi:hypothetical protein ERIN107935_03885 [Erysipelothrix inopinata]
MVHAYVIMPRLEGGVTVKRVNNIIGKVILMLGCIIIFQTVHAAYSSRETLYVPPKGGFVISSDYATKETTSTYGTVETWDVSAWLAPTGQMVSSSNRQYYSKSFKIGTGYRHNLVTMFDSARGSQLHLRVNTNGFDPHGLTIKAKWNGDHN